MKAHLRQWEWALQSRTAGKNEDKPYAYVMATDEAGFERGCFKLIEGRMAKNEDEIVIPRHLKTNGRIDIKVGMR